MGFEDDLQDEFGGGAEDCTLTDFHTDDDDNNIFPLDKPINDADEKSKKGIFSYLILKLITKTCIIIIIYIRIYHNI